MRHDPSPLLSADFITRLDALRDIVFRLRRRGELEGAGTGHAPEFDTHRSYEPGDDPRYIDWNVFARLEKLLVRLYVVDDEMRVSVLVDCSRSMTGESFRKRDVSLKLASSFAYLALAGGHSLMLGAFADEILSAVGPYRSPQQFPLCLHFLASLPEAERTDIVGSLGRYLAGRRGSNLVVVVSDFLQPGDLAGDLERLSVSGVELHLVQVSDPGELEPRLGGECLLLDRESADSSLMFVDQALLDRIRGKVAEYWGRLDAVCRKRGIPRLVVGATDDFERSLVAHLLARAGSGGR